jgi:hypothetical protein
MFRLSCRRGRGGHGNCHASAIRTLDRRNKAVAQPRPSFDKSSALRRISKDAAQLVNRCVQAVVERHIGVRPKLLTKRLSIHHLPSALDQRFQDLEGFLFQLNAHAVLANLTRFERDFESAESHNRGQVFHFIHGSARGISWPRPQAARPILSFSLKFLN